MKVAAVYARVSTADQVKGTSLDGQVALCEQYAKENSYSVVKVVQEDASGARLDRPKLGELRDMAERREIDALVVFDPDRLSRSMAHTMLLLEEFERNKADVLFVNAPREDSPEGEMLFGMRALFAQYERAKIAERTRRGKERRIQEGRVMASQVCNYGYRYAPSERGIEIFEEEAKWARKMYEWMALEGCSLRQIAERLTENNVPTKTGSRTWQPATSRGILANEVNAGTWHYGKRTGIEPRSPRNATRKRSKSSKDINPRSEWLSVDIPAIVSRELFDAVQAQLKRNKETAPRNNSKHQYLFRGLLTCARCGHKMYGHRETYSGRGSYQCPGRTMKNLYSTMEKRCDQPNVPLERIETVVWDEVVLQLSDEKVLRERLEQRQAELKRSRKDDEAELEVIATFEAGLKQEANKYLDLHMDGTIDRNTLRERIDIVREKQANLAKSKAEVNERLAQSKPCQIDETEISRLCEIAREGLPYATFDDKRLFLESMAVQLKLNGRELTITGLITERTLTVAGRCPHPSDTDDTILCNTHGREAFCCVICFS